MWYILSMETKYTLRQFNQDFKTDADALDFIFKMRYPDGAICKCGKKDCFYQIKKRKCYCCSHCGYQLSPTAGTIFHKSETILKSWLFAMFLISNSKNGVSAMELMRQIGVTYKTAWRMNHQIRKLMKQPMDKLSGEVEADETYIGGKMRNMHKERRDKCGQGTGGVGKEIVMGLLERKGKIKVKHIGNVRRHAVQSEVRQHVEKGSNVFTDALKSYNGLNQDYIHEVIDHAKEYVRGNVHTNGLEGFWSQLKRSINGTFHHVSPQHLRAYVDEFCYRYNQRRSAQPIFRDLSGRVAEQHA
jgi:transposase-like protein